MHCKGNNCSVMCTENRTFCVRGVAASLDNSAMNGDFEATKGSAALYAWFVWEKGWKEETVVRWI